MRETNSYYEGGLHGKSGGMDICWVSSKSSGKSKVVLIYWKYEGNVIESKPYWNRKAISYASYRPSHIVLLLIWFFFFRVSSHFVCSCHKT